MTKAQYKQYQADVAGFITREGLSFLSTGTDNGDGNVDPWFSKSPCECCGVEAGSREYLFARDADNEIVQFEICEDCVYYVNYGHLDDMTMLELEA